MLSLLVMYGLTNVAAIRLLAAGERRWEVVLPGGGIAVAAYVLYRNVWPVPPSPFDVFPYLVGAWLAVGLALSWALPGLAGRVRAGLGS